MRQPLPGHSTFQPGHTMSNHAPSASGASRMTMRVKLILSQTAFIASLSVLRFAMLIIIAILGLGLIFWVLSAAWCEIKREQDEQARALQARFGAARFHPELHESAPEPSKDR